MSDRAAGSGVEQKSMVHSNLSLSRGKLWLRIARLLALAFMLFCVFLFVVGVAAFNEFAALNPDLFTVYSWSAEEMAGVLSRLGLSFNGWLQLDQVMAILTAVIFCSVGGLIFIRKRDDWFSLYVAVWMVMFGTLDRQPDECRPPGGIPPWRTSSFNSAACPGRCSSSCFTYSRMGISSHAGRVGRDW